MNISLPHELEAWVQAKVDSGQYASASEVIREALRLQAQFDQARAMHLGALNSAIDIGLQDAQDGRVLDVDESRARIDRRRAAKRSA